MKYDIDAFYNNILRILKEKGISQKEVYQSIGMAQPNFSNAINRKNGKRFTIEQMIDIAEYLDCSLDYLFTETSSEKGNKYIKIPEISKWTCLDVLRLLFSLRKSNSGMKFNSFEIDEDYEKGEITALYFDKKITISNSAPDYETREIRLINSIIYEWAQIIESTENLDFDSQELMLDTWERKKLEQVSNVALSEDLFVEYEVDNKKRYNVKKSGLPFS